MKVGGRDFDMTNGEVVQRMREEEPEVIRKHYVMVGGEAYPPKQVLAHVTGWERTSFTTMEAQRVLAKIGITSRETAYVHYPLEKLPRAADSAGNSGPVAAPEDRVAALEAAITTAQEAIAGLAARVRLLEQASG